MTRRLALLCLFISAVADATPFDKGGINGVGARAIGMGGAVVAQPGDASALWWNPAGITLQKDYDLYYQYGSLLEGSTLDNLVAQRGVIPGVDLSYGVGYRREIETVDSGYTEDTSLLSVGFPLTADHRFNFGTSLKIYDTELNNLSEGEAYGFGLDLGFLYRPPLPHDGLTLGMAVMDFQASLNSVSGANEAPPQLFQVGASYLFDPDTIAELDSELVTDRIDADRSSSGFRLGVEHWLDIKAYDLEKLLALRVGYLQSSSLTPAAFGGVFTMGLGLQWRGATVDYAYMQDVSGLGPSNRISGTYHFRPFALAAKTTPVPPLSVPQTAPLPISPTVKPILRRPGTEFKILPEAREFSPGYASVHPSLNFLLRYNRGPMRGYSVTFTRKGSALALRTLQGRVMPRSLRWDGRDRYLHQVADGFYTATLRIFSRDGSISHIAAEFDVDTRRPVLSLDAHPKIFVPGDDANPVTLVINANKAGSVPLHWQLLIQSLQGDHVKLYEGLGSPPASLKWDGTDSQGKNVSSQNLYYATLSVEMPSGAIARSSRLALGSDVTPFTGESALKLTLVTIKFQPHAAALASGDLAGLKVAVDAVKKYGTDYTVQVLGYSSAQETGGVVSTLELSFLRAKAVQSYLSGPGGLDPLRVEAMGFGTERPSGSEATADGQAENRRVDVILFTK